METACVKLDSSRLQTDRDVKLHLQTHVMVSRALQTANAFLDHAPATQDSKKEEIFAYDRLHARAYLAVKTNGALTANANVFLDLFLSQKASNAFLIKVRGWNGEHGEHALYPVVLENKSELDNATATIVLGILLRVENAIQWRALVHGRNGNNGFHALGLVVEETKFVLGNAMVSIASEILLRVEDVIQSSVKGHGWNGVRGGDVLPLVAEDYKLELDDATVAIALETLLKEEGAIQ